MILEEIIRRNIRDVLNEGISSVLYHFTQLERAMKIIAEDCLRSYRPNGISFSRVRNSEEGYCTSIPRSRALVRFEVDGEMLGHRYKGGPYDYYGGRRWTTTFKANSLHPKGFISNDDMLQSGFAEHQYDETEDTVHTEEIKPFSRYIKRVDVLLDPKRVRSFSYTDSVKRLAQLRSDVEGGPYEGKVYVYDNPKDFNFQTENCERL